MSMISRVDSKFGLVPSNIHPIFVDELNADNTENPSMDNYCRIRYWNHDTNLMIRYDS